MRRRIWCETVPTRELGGAQVIELLRLFAVTPIVAVWPATRAEASEAITALDAYGLAPAVWPMLEDADGRWLGAANAPRFARFVEALAEDLAPREIVLDLEPPIEALRAGLASAAVSAHLLPPGADPAAHRAAQQALAALVDHLHARGVQVSAAVAPPVLAHEAWEARLGTPVSGVAWDHLSPMLYTSIIEGWSRGALGRADTRALFAASCLASAARFGERAGASLGAVGTGAFGDEPVYRSPADLADDVAIARAAGLDDLALFDLGGVLRRAPAEAWLEAFVSTPAAPSLPEPTPRSRAAVAAMRAAGAALGALAHVRRFMERPLATLR